MSRPPPIAPDEARAVVRYAEGWRKGKPEEDPDKLKRWGWISAKPSEFLIRMRGGDIASAGQGATTFKWPWDSVAIVPTSVQRLQFTADQITQEKVGVKVTGIAVYRIADPLIAFRMLNFSFPERAQEKLRLMMEEMCVGAVRRLVANLTVEQCLTRRKDALASELIKEIAPVVSGSGRLEDKTIKGWGLVVDTIEIQDVQVLSQQVFTNMQARFRHDQERQAREAELAKELAIKQEETSTERSVEQSKVASATELRRLRLVAEEESRLEKLASEGKVEAQRLAHERSTRAGQLQAERELQLAKLAVEDELRRKKQAAAEQVALEELAAQARHAQQRLQVELETARIQREVEQERHAARLAEQERAAELERATALVAQAKFELAAIEAKTVELEVHKQKLLGSFELERAASLRQIENSLSPEAIQLAIAQKLPELAQAFQQKMGEVHVTAVDGANPFGYIAAAVEGVMGLARSAGLELPAKPSKS